MKNSTVTDGDYQEGANPSQNFRVGNGFSELGGSTSLELDRCFRSVEK
jgi:hypothetical protein